MSAKVFSRIFRCWCHGVPHRKNIKISIAIPLKTSLDKTFHQDGKISLPSIATPPISPLPYMYSVVKSIKANGLADRNFFKIRFSAVRHSFNVNSKTNIYFCGYKARKGGRFCGFFTHHKANKE
jgi:hypothetical protein